MKRSSTIHIDVGICTNRATENPGSRNSGNSLGWVEGHPLRNESLLESNPRVSPTLGGLALRGHVPGRRVASRARPRAPGRPEGAGRGAMVKGLDGPALFVPGTFSGVRRTLPARTPPQRVQASTQDVLPHTQACTHDVVSLHPPDTAKSHSHMSHAESLEPTLSRGPCTLGDFTPCESDLASGQPSPGSSEEAGRESFAVSVAAPGRAQDGRPECGLEEGRPGAARASPPPGTTRADDSCAGVFQESDSCLSP